MSECKKLTDNLSSDSIRSLLVVLVESISFHCTPAKPEYIPDKVHILNNIRVFFPGKAPLYVMLVRLRLIRGAINMSTFNLTVTRLFIYFNLALRM